jgi:hypothetical protein
MLFIDESVCNLNATPAGLILTLSRPASMVIRTIARRFVMQYAR